MYRLLHLTDKRKTHGRYLCSKTSFIRSKIRLKIYPAKKYLSFWMHMSDYNHWNNKWKNIAHYQYRVSGRFMVISYNCPYSGLRIKKTIFHMKCDTPIIKERKKANLSEIMSSFNSCFKEIRKVSSPYKNCTTFLYPPQEHPILTPYMDFAEKLTKRWPTESHSIKYFRDY